MPNDDVAAFVAYFATRLRDMSFPVVAKHVFDVPEERRKDPTLRGSTFWAHLAHDRVVGSGPYQFVEWKTDDQLVVERNDQTRDRHLDLILVGDTGGEFLQPDPRSRQCPGQPPAAPRAGPAEDLVGDAGDDRDAEQA